MKHFLVTGASTGIGAACALWLEERGHTVFAGVRQTADGEALRRMAGSKLIPLRLEVTDTASIQAALEQIQSHTAQLDGVVNNAGIVVAGPMEFLPLEEVRRILEVNVLGQIAVTQACLPLLRPAKGRIVMMSSISGRFTSPLMGPYSASKYALEAISDAFRRELAPWGLEVSVVEPGSIQTPIWGKGVQWGEALLQKLSPQAQEWYGPSIKAIMGYIQGQQTQGLPPKAVAKVVEHALLAPRPKTRYLVGTDAKLAALALRLLPDRVVDSFLVRRLSGRK